jgi:hypothetical protein
LQRNADPRIADLDPQDSGPHPVASSCAASTITARYDEAIEGDRENAETREDCRNG